MTRRKSRRRNTINGNRPRTQMPTDAEQRANVERLDALKKQRHDEAIIDKLRADRTEREARDAEHAAIADIITQGNKQPKTWNEINSTTGSGGIAQNYQ